MRAHRWPPISGHGCSITEKYRACSASSLHRRSWLTKGWCWPACRGKKEGKGEGGRKRRRKRGNRRLGRKEKGSFSKGSWTPSPSSFFLSFFLPIFHHFLLCPPLSSRNPFYAAMDSQSGRWSRVNWHSSRPLSCNDTRLYFFRSSPALFSS